MTKPTKNFIVDAAAFTGFVLLATTGVLMRYVLPPGSGRSMVIWGLDRHGWGSIHFWISLILLGVLAVHLILHWRWIITLVTGKPREGSGMRVGLGIVGLIGLLALSVSPLLSPVETTLRSGTGRDLSVSHEPGQIQIWGSMTLHEVQQNTGVPVGHIIEKLNLPPDVDKDERLGKLKKTYGFTMEDVRHVVGDYEKEN